MGIDGLDLAFRLEKTFGFQINRKDGELWFVFQTPGTIHDFVWQRLQGVRPVPPIVAPWQLSEHIENLAMGLPGARNRVWFRSFANIWQVENRIGNWQRLAEILKCRLPELVELPNDQISRFPNGCRWPSELAGWLLQNHPEVLPIQRDESQEEPPAGADKWTQEAVWDEVQKVIADCLAVDIRDVTRDVRMVEDLGMG